MAFLVDLEKSTVSSAPGVRIAESIGQREVYKQYEGVGKVNKGFGTLQGSKVE